jgi:hypothetical protein
MIFHKKQTILLILSFILFFMGLAYLAKGFYLLAFDGSPERPIDLLARWTEQQYIYLKTYPYYMDSAAIDPRLGRVESGGYPPWAFFTGFFIFPNISWTLTRFHQLLLNILSIGILSRFAYQIGLPFGQLSAYFFVASCLAISSNCTTLGTGQYGIIINAFLIGVYYCVQTRKNILAGILMGMALAKPSISAPYILSLAIYRKVNPILIAFSYIVFATLYIAWLTRLNFGNVLSRFLDQIKYVADDGFSGINILISLGFNKNLAILLLVAIATGISVVIFQKLRYAPLLTLFASASVIGRVFIYHRIYDDVMLVFLLLALLKLAFQFPNRYNIASIALTGLTLWLPASVQNRIPYWPSIQIFIWLSLLFYLVLNKAVPMKKFHNHT